LRTTFRDIFVGLGQQPNESRTLAVLRDTLLPKLLSGEIRLAEGEKAVEEALQ
jgi:type I restriction enzyme, S subunit